jgi:hypothetical protein
VTVFWIRQVPGYALHENGLLTQIDVGTLVSSQERRALFIQRLNRWFSSSTGLPGITFVRASEGTFRKVVFSTLFGTRTTNGRGGASNSGLGEQKHVTGQHPSLFVWLQKNEKGISGPVLHQIGLQGKKVFALIISSME